MSKPRQIDYVDVEHCDRILSCLSGGFGVPFGAYSAIEWCWDVMQDERPPQVSCGGIVCLPSDEGMMVCVRVGVVREARFNESNGEEFEVVEGGGVEPMGCGNLQPAFEDEAGFVQHVRHPCRVVRRYEGDPGDECEQCVGQGQKGEGERVHPSMYFSRLDYRSPRLVQGQEDPEGGEDNV